MEDDALEKAAAPSRRQRSLHSLLFSFFRNPTSSKSSTVNMKDDALEQCIAGAIQPSDSTERGTTSSIRPVCTRDSTHANFPTNIEKCHLLRIPPELRNRIWEYVLIDSDAIKVHRGTREPGLLRTCKEIRDETIKLYYHNNIFDLEAWDCDVKLVEAFRALLRKYLSSKQVQLRLCLCGNPNWPNLKDWCQRVHSGKCGYSTGDDTATRYESAINGALAIALSCKKQPWKMCETALVSYRRVIGHIDRRWLDG